MSISKRTMGAAGKASTLAVFALAAAACAEDTANDSYDPAADAQTDEAYESPVADARTDDAYQDQVADSRATDAYDDATSGDMGAEGSAMGSDAATQAGTQDPQQLASTLGVSELNEIENWKVTHEGEEIGEIDRIGVDRSTGEILAVVGLEGVVGINMKEVGIPLNRLQQAEDETLSTDLTKDELQQKRDIDPWDGSDSMDDVQEEANL